jgi:hypothetical protein
MHRWFKRGADAVGAALFAALFLVFMVQVVARFGFNRPLPWTDEVAVMLYVWVILWAAGFIVPERELKASGHGDTPWRRRRAMATVLMKNRLQHVDTCGSRRFFHTRHAIMP